MEGQGLAAPGATATTKTGTPVKAVKFATASTTATAPTIDA